MDPALSMLVAIEDPADASAALRFAGDLASRGSVDLAVLHVVPAEGSDEMHRRRLVDAHAALVGLLQALDIPGESLVRSMPPGSDIASVILRVAQERGDDFVAVTSKRASSTSGRLLGSTAQHLLRAGRYPVLVVPP